MTGLTEEQLAEMIALLRPAPEGWVKAAIELPRARGVIDELAARASRDDEVRRTILDSLEDALRDAGVEPRPQLLERLKVRLSGLE